MDHKKSLIWVLGSLTNIGIGICGLVSGYLAIMALLALFGQLPDKLAASFEVPVHLQKMNELYPVKNLHEDYYSAHIEVKDAKLEVLSSKKRWPQALVYLLAGIYVSLFFLILVKLSRVLKTFKTSHPFSWENVGHIRWIGALLVGLGLYEFLVSTVVARIFHDKFRVSNALMLEMPSFWDLNFVALFAGLVLLALSEVFKVGAGFQELESQTV